MAESAEDDEIFWVDPEKRGVIPLDAFHISRSLKKRLLSDNYLFSANMCFDRVVDTCAKRDETWINATIRKLYSELHKMGFAHSIEVWHNARLIGGLYGVCVGGAFFGESMFSNETDGSKLALVSLVARLKVGGFTLLDTQFLTPHLATLGGIEVPQMEYHKLLEIALEIEADFWKLPAETTSQEFWQLSTQTS